MGVSGVKQPRKGTETGCRLRVRVQPGAKRDALVEVRDGVLRLRLQAPPVEGAANKRLVELLAKKLGVRKSAISLIRGHRHREKLLAIEGLGESELGRRLRELLFGK